MTQPTPSATTKTDELDEIIKPLIAKSRCGFCGNYKCPHITEAKAAIDKYTKEAVIKELESLSVEIDKFSPKTIDRGNEAYNPAFQDFKMGFNICKGFTEKTLNNHLKSLKGGIDG